MQRIFFFLLGCTILISCGVKEEDSGIDSFTMLEKIQYDKIQHFQPRTEIDILKRNNIKAVTIITKFTGKSESDSLTFHRLDKGRIITTATNECNSFGCLPFTIQKRFIYDGDKIKKINTYTYKKKYSYRKQYWDETDTTKLSLYEWEDYTYPGDSVIVETGPLKWVYQKDKNNRIKSNTSYYRKNNKIVSLATYIYGDNNLEIRVKNQNMNEPIIERCKINGPNSAEKIADRGKFGIFKVEYLFNDSGLLSEIKTYKNDSLIDITSYNYIK